MLKADGFDDCIFGVCERNGEIFVLYDRQRMVDKLMKRDGMSSQQADEYIGYNIAGAFITDGPGYMYEMTLEEIEEYYE